MHRPSGSGGWRGSRGEDKARGLTAAFSALQVHAGVSHKPRSTWWRLVFSSLCCGAAAVPPARSVPDRPLSKLWEELSYSPFSPCRANEYISRTFALLIQDFSLLNTKHSSSSVKVISTLHTDLRNRVHWCFTRQVYADDDIFHPKCVMNNSGGPVLTTLLLTKYSNFPAAFFALISYFIFWKTSSAKGCVHYVCAVLFNLLRRMWWTYMPNMQTLCFSNHKNILFVSVNC